MSSVEKRLQIKWEMPKKVQQQWEQRRGTIGGPRLHHMCGWGWGEVESVHHTLNLYFKIYNSHFILLFVDVLVGWILYYMYT